jgi:hypothetical protein
VTVALYCPAVLITAAIVHAIVWLQIRRAAKRYEAAVGLAVTVLESIARLDDSVTIRAAAFRESHRLAKEGA